ncbi:MAG: hypothetical protein CO093_10195 [Alphaproteobacteria bacterium CG_4_9_14_3_um_filter_47_13]|nr:MAG: hypothetical protein CO093_10195 [Alphaproteobacteria bacterium CG_4_9_14_3_um_filter_47_13]
MTHHILVLETGEPLSKIVRIAFLGREDDLMPSLALDETGYKVKNSMSCSCRWPCHCADKPKEHFKC